MPTIVLLLLVVTCYTITSLNDKYAVSKAKLTGDQMTFIMAAATSVFMLFILPFSDRTCAFTPLTVLFILLLFLSKLLEFQMSAKILTELSAFELKAWLGIVMFLSYFTDILMGTGTFTIAKTLCIALTAAGLIMIAASGKHDVNYKKIALPLILYLASRFGYGLTVTAINADKRISSTMALFFALILLAVVLLPKAGLKQLIKEKPKETAIVALAKLPNAFGLLLENAIIAVSLVQYSFIQPLIIIVLFVISLINREKYSKTNFAGSLICIAGILLFQVCSL
ncbi:MAG: hypothetical protein ACI4XF_02660 [Oscillospiraceae bacterium]